jgi:hypothetical protein
VASTVQLNKWLEYLLRRSSDSELLENLTAQVMNAEMYFKAGHVNPPRVFYVVSIYDGLNETILKKVRAEADVKGAILSLGGNQSGMNESLCRIAVENDAIKGWNPKQHIHEVPTLILKDGADPVTQGGQADYVFREALCGKRVLIEFPGVGHSMSLPRMIEDNINTRDYLLQEFIAHDFDNLKKTVLPKVRGAFEELLKQAFKEAVTQAIFGPGADAITKDNVSRAVQSKVMNDILREYKQWKAAGSDMNKWPFSKKQNPVP